ncbi:MAG: hypothetical protein RR450_09625 [Oscillospiraceae bacterium]
MERDLETFLTGVQRETLTEDWSFQTLPPWRIWEAKREAEAMEKGQTDRGACANACLLARCMQKGEKQYFANGTEVLLLLSHKEIEQLSARYADFNRRVNPGPEAENQRVEGLKIGLSAAGPARLRWRVLRSFGVLPSEERGKSMTERDYLYCALNLLLDDEEELAALCPTCRRKAEEARCPACGTPTMGTAGAVNASFDTARYERLKRGENR